MKKVLSDELKQEIQELYNSGMPIKQIARETGVGKNKIRSLLPCTGWGCLNCGHIFYNFGNYKKHIVSCAGRGTRAERRKPPIVCDKCKHLFKNSENYKRHILVCNGRGPQASTRPGEQTCKHCNKIFTNAENCRRHVFWCEKVSKLSLQEEYDSGLSTKQISDKYSISLSFLNKNIKRGRTRAQATKKRKEQEPSLYFFGGTRRKSRGEQEFKRLLEESKTTNDFKIIEQYHLFSYRLDFAIPDIKLDIEIDGMQHYTERGIIEGDTRRDKLLIDNGWSVYRIASKDFLARPNVVFSNFYSFLLKYSGEHNYVSTRYLYCGQVIDGDARWTREREEKILNSGINFLGKGWTVSLGNLLEVHPNTARRWVQRNMPKFYEERCRTPKIDYPKIYGRS